MIGRARRPAIRTIERVVRRVVGLAAGLMAGLGLFIGGTAWAFDIPTPTNQPSAVATQPAPPPQAPGPLTPLPATTEGQTQAGAGHLPEGVTVTTDIRPAPAGLLVRAPFLVTLTVIDKQRSVAAFTLHRPYGDAIVTRRISIDQKLVNQDGRLVNQSVYRFAVTPLQPGTIELQFAEMTFRAVGDAQSHYAFIPVARSLTVRPLPEFWPEYLPVTPGLSVEAADLPPLAAGQPVEWTLTVRGEGLTEQSLQKLLSQQMISPPSLRLGTPDIRLSPTDPVPATDPLAETFDVRIPLLPDPQGQAVAQAQLPALRLPFIDSRAAQPGAHLSEVLLPARLVHWTLPAHTGWREWLRHWWWRILLLLAMAYGGIYALRDIGQRLATRRRHQQAKRRIAQIDDAGALLGALKEITGQATIGAMIARAPNPRFMTALQALEALCYRDPRATGAEGTADFNAVRDEIARWLPPVFFTPST